MALNNLGLGLIFTAKDLATGTMNKVTRSFSGMDQAALKANESYQRSFAVMGAGLAIMMAGAVALTGAFALTNKAAEFEHGLAAVGAVAGASAAEMGYLHDEALKLAIQLRVAPKETTEGLENLASQGFNARESMTLLTPSLYLAQGGQISLAQSTATVASAMHVFGIAMEDSAGIADKLLAISNQTALGAKDLELALGTVGRGASLTSQNLDEMLISMGLVKNTGVDASVAAQSVSSALIFMAGRSDKFKELGLSVTDSSGKFKDFLDIVMETSGVLETKYTDQAERAAAATDLFSRFGLQAYSAIVKQLSTGIRNETTGAMLTGAAAVEYLREEMEKASGTAKEFRDRLLSTFEGQKQALGAIMESTAVVMGEAFIPAFKPVVAGAVELLARFAEAVRSMPKEVKEPLAKALVVMAALATVGGAVIAATAAFVLIKPFLVAMGAALLGVAKAMLPFIVVIGLAVAAVYAFRYAVQNNIGGIGDLFTRAMAVARMAIHGIAQLFSQGGFSGPLMEELNRAENAGLKRFLISVYQIAYRVVQFFRGMVVGFEAAIDAAAPSFERLSAAVQGVVGAFTSLGGAGASAVAGMPSQEFAERGALIGTFLGKMVEVLAEVATAVANFVQGFVEGFGTALQFFAPVFAELMPQLEYLGTQFKGLLVDLGVLTDATTEGTSFWRIFGQAIGWAAGIVGTILVGALDLVVATIGTIIEVVRIAIGVIAELVNVAMYVGNIVWNVLKTVVAGLENVMDFIAMGIGSLAEMLPEGLRTTLGMDLDVQSGRDAAARIQQRGKVVDDLVGSFRYESSPQVAYAEADASNQASNAEALQRVAEMVDRQKKEQYESSQQANVYLDGEKVGELVSRAQRSSQAATFTPVSMPR